MGTASPLPLRQADMNALRSSPFLSPAWALHANEEGRMRTVLAMVVAVSLVAGTFSVASAADEKKPNPQQERMKAIPTRYYKIVLRTKSDGTLEALTIVLPNLQRGLPLPPGSFLSGPKLTPAEADTYLAGHTASIGEVQRLTGLNLLPNLTGDPLKDVVASELWPRN